VSESLPIPQSPINRFHPDWARLSLDGKRNYLIASGQARDWSAASSMLSRHGAAVKLRRKVRAAQQAPTAAKREKLIVEIAGMIDSATVAPACPRCERTLYTLTQHTDGRREKTVHLSHRLVDRELYCLDCITALVDAGEVLRTAVNEQRRAA
jgi:predicted metal-binding membrane protein